MGMAHGTPSFGRLHLTYPWLRTDKDQTREDMLSYYVLLASISYKCWSVDFGSFTFYYYDMLISLYHMVASFVQRKMEVVAV